MDIGTEPYVIAGALIGVVAQRLVRRLCVNCRRQYTPPSETLRALNISDADASAIPFYKSVGCDQCNHTGYRGRIGIYEVMRVTDKLRRAIAARASSPEEW
jgi:type IV pilus assembly protein PilB